MSLLHEIADFCFGVNTMTGATPTSIELPPVAFDNLYTQCAESADVPLDMAVRVWSKPAIELAYEGRTVWIRRGGAP